MKKLMIVLAILIGVVILGAPYISGKVAESETHRLVEEINQSPANYGAIKILSYDRSFRITESTFRYMLPAALSMATKIQSIDYNCHSKHGITGINYSCGLIKKDAYKRFVDSNTGGRDPISITGSVSLFGSVHQTLKIDSIKNLESGPSTLNLANTELSVRTDRQLSSYDVSGHSDGITLLNGAERISIGAIQLKGTLDRSEAGLLVGDTYLDIASLMTKIGNETYTIEGLLVETNTLENGEYTDSKTSIAVDSVLTANAPFNSIDDLNLELDINGINTVAFMEYQDFYSQLQNEVLTSLESNTEPDIASDQAQQIIPILEKMLRPELLFDSKFSVRLNQKPAKINIIIDLLDSLTMEQMKTLAITPESLLEKFDIKVDITLNKELVDSTPMLANVIPKASVFETSKDNYTSKWRLSKQVQLNGEQLTLAELNAILMQAATP